MAKMPMAKDIEQPVVFPDRVPVEILKKDYPDVLDALQENNIGKTDTKNTVHFCGLASATVGSSVFFLPRQTEALEYNIQIDLARLTMQVLARFGREVESRKGASRESSDNSSLIALIHELANDFRQNGIYAERVRYNSRNQGKPNWQRTLSNNLPFFSSDDAPVYSEIVTRKALDAHENPLSMIQSEVLREIMNRHSWWLGGLNSRTNELYSFKKPKGNRNQWSRVLKHYRQNLFSSRALFLVETLSDYLDKTGTESDGVFLYGVEDFQTVWEHMLRKVIPNVESGWNTRLPKPGYIRNSDGSVVMHERGMQTDIITREGANLKIVDAKYYEATGIKSVPGWSDIVKQLFYEKAVRSVDPSLNVTNCFIFPASKSRPPEFAEIRMYNQNKVEVPSLSKIECKYAETSSVMNAYSKRQKADLGIF